MAEIYFFLLITFSLIFGVSLAFRSNYVNKYKNRYFICAVLTNIGILVSEIGMRASWYYDIRWMNISMNAINYALAPLLPYFIVLMNRKCWKRVEQIGMIPAVFIILMALTSQQTKFLFYIDENNHYNRGSLFMLSLGVCLLYFLMLVITSFREYRDADTKEKIYLLAILIWALGGVLLQVLISETSAMWTTTGIALILYYMFELELSNKYDVLTGVRNRRAFDRHKDKLLSDSHYSLVVFDINGLKPVNDNMGHEEGDKLIMGVANILANTFYGIGKIYRIGGDEFCIICHEKNEEKAEKALTELEQNIAKANKNGNNKFTISVSYGMEIHGSEDRREYHEVFNTADDKMYKMKQDFYKNKEKSAEGNN